MSRRKAELGVRLVGVLGLVVFWTLAFTDPSADPAFRSGALAIFTVGMAAAQQPWVAWLRRVGLAIVVWPPCVVVTVVLLWTFPDLVPRLASIKTAFSEAIAISLGAAVFLGGWVLPWLWGRWAPPPRVA